MAKRLIKPVPVIGSIFALGLAAYEIRKKGLIPGAIHVGLDVTPVIGTAKNVVEIFTGDLIPDKRVNGSKSVSPDSHLPMNQSDVVAVSGAKRRQIRVVDR